MFMRRNYKLLLLIVAVSATLLAFTVRGDFGRKTFDNPEKDKLLIELLTFVIERGHYDPAAIDDNFSKGVYKDFIDALDPSKRFFLQSDIDEFSKYENQIDDQIKAREFTFFDLAYSTYVKRMQESRSYYKEILGKPFDYKVNETIDTDYDKLPYAKNVKELKERWRKQIKLVALSSLTDKIKLEEDKKKTDSLYTSKKIEELEKETRESSLNSLDEHFNFIKDLDRNDWFGVYINAISSRFDPHTNYMAPDDKERFDASMSGKFEGIGARLQKKK